MTLTEMIRTMTPTALRSAAASFEKAAALVTEEGRGHEQAGDVQKASGCFRASDQLLHEAVILGNAANDKESEVLLDYTIVDRYSKAECLAAADSFKAVAARMRAEGNEDFARRADRGAEQLRTLASERQ
jgi:hypothetical protein